MQSQKSSHLRNTGVLLLLIVAIAALLSVTSYEYTVSISNSITASSIQDTNANAQIEATEINHILVDQLSAVAKNLQILAASSVVASRNVTAAAPVFSAAANATSAITYSYIWGEADGHLLLARNATGSLTPVAGLNLTQRPYFVGAEQSGTTYYSGAIDSTKGVPTIYVADPTYNMSVVDGQQVKKFSGIVAASVGVSLLGQFLQSQLPDNLKAALGAIAPDGIVLYSGNQTLVGQSVFGTEFQSALPAGFRGQFNDFLNRSLDGGAGVDNLSYNGTNLTLAYQPVLTDSQSRSNQTESFAVLYIVASDVLAASQASQITLLRVLFEVIIFGIGTAAIVAALVVLRWNRSLDTIVKSRTADLVLANQEISAQSQAQRDLINIAAHELRTPTQSILANSELLKDALDPETAPEQISSSPAGPGGPTPGSRAAATFQMQESDVRALVDSTFRNARRLQKLTQNLLEVARIDSKTVQLELETFDLNEKIARVIADLQNILDVDGSGPDRIRIALESSEDELPVRADRVKTYEILSNLLGNAIRHSKGGGKITVTTGRSDGYARVHIRDEGTGIDPAILPRLFEKFVTSSGTGLGLFISKSYVEAQGGKIWAENNEGDGRAGATFTFTLPLAPAGEVTTGSAQPRVI